MDPAMDHALRSGTGEGEPLFPLLPAYPVHDLRGPLELNDSFSWTESKLALPRFSSFLFLWPKPFGNPDLSLVPPSVSERMNLSENTCTPTQPN